MIQLFEIQKWHYRLCPEVWDLNIGKFLDWGFRDVFLYHSRIISELERNFSLLLSSLSHTGYQECSLLRTEISVCEMSSRTSSSLKTEAVRCLEISVTNYSCRSETFRKNTVFLWVCAVLGLSDLLRKRSFLQRHTHTSLLSKHWSTSCTESEHWRRIKEDRITLQLSLLTDEL